MWRWLRTFFEGRAEAVHFGGQPHRKFGWLVSRARIEAESSQLKAERSELAAERRRLEAERAALKEEWARLKAERTHCAGDQRRASRRGKSAPTPTWHAGHSAIEQQIGARHNAVTAGMIGFPGAVGTTTPPESEAQRNQRVLRDAVIGHQELVKSLEADARRRRVSVTPEVLKCLEKLKFDLEQLILTSEAAEPLNRQIGRIRKQSLLLVIQERARWQLLEVSEVTQAKTPREPLQGRAATQPAQTAERPMSARERYLLMEDPGQGGHRDLSRD